MYKKIIAISMIFIFLCGFFACRSRMPEVAVSELDKLFANDFRDLRIPEVVKIKKMGEKKNFPYVNFNKVWESIILVLMQQGIIVKASKEEGIITAITVPPLTVFIEENNNIVTVYLYWMEELCRRIDKPQEILIKLTPEIKEQMTENFFGQLATQVYASQKWKYLER